MAWPEPVIERACHQVSDLGSVGVRASLSGPERLARRSDGQEAKLAFTTHLLMENRSGLVVSARLTHATGTAEPEAALAMPGTSRKTIGAVRNYDTAKFVAAARPYRADVVYELREGYQAASRLIRRGA